MADEKLTEGVEDIDAAADQVVESEETVEEAVAAVEETVEETVAAVEETQEAAADEAEAVVEEAQEIDEKVETAVRNVAEEAEAELKEAEATAQRRERRSKQARAEKAAKENAPATEAPAKASGLAKLGVPAWLGICAVSLVLGLLLGHFALGGSSASVDLSGKTTVTEAELDNAYAVYTYNGETNTISVREVIEANGTLESFLAEDGSYKLPSAEYAVNAARTQILLKEAESRGISVSDEDVAAYAEENLGTSDFDAIAQTYGMEADAVKDIIMENCVLNALRSEVVEGELPTMPEAPATAEEGKEDEVTQAYADYIIALAGDEWDSEKGAWVDETSAYATALSGSDFSADGASYNAATSAYYVAYQLYSEKQTELTNQWAEFYNGLLSNASIQVGTLVS